MTSLQCIQASSWSHVHVPPDGMLASVYLALFGIAYDTPPGDARCVCQFSNEFSNDPGVRNFNGVTDSSAQDEERGELDEKDVKWADENWGDRHGDLRIDRRGEET